MNEDAMLEMNSRLATLDGDDEFSLLALGSILLRRRLTIIGLGLFGAAIGLGATLLSARVFVSSATFIPEGQESGVSGLAQAATQLGIRVPTSGGGWGPVGVQSPCCGSGIFLSR